MTKTPLFQRPFFVSLFATIAAVAWGWAYPLIKLGFAEFQITTEMTGSKMLFAGIRFFISGMIILFLYQTKRTKRDHKDIRTANDCDSCSPKGTAESSPQQSPFPLAYILLFSLFNTTLHYTFFYIGLSHTEGARSAILNSLSVFSVVILACIFFKSDRMTTQKIVGCIIGFAGILALNLEQLPGLPLTASAQLPGTEPSAGFSWLGDGFIILNALCGATASLLTRDLSKRIDIFAGTGYSLSIGGALLIIPGLLLDGTLPSVTPLGLFYLLLLIGISTVGFGLHNKLLSCNPVGKVAIYNSLIPIVGAFTSCLCLGEQFRWHYSLSALLATLGIYIINKGK